LEFLLPYSPDFNPIEEAFSKVKAFIHHHHYLLAKDGNGIVYDMMVTMDIVNVSNAVGYYMHAGY
ncbi:hypothetical protein ARMGADRAFT_863367, partial [Armillaria gallica]